MTGPKFIFAHADKSQGSCPYLNISAADNGDILITLRSDDAGGSIATHTLPEALLVPLVKELSDHLASKSLRVNPSIGLGLLPIEKMVNRFLGWKLPDDFGPDGGISFDVRRKGTPSGTNLFTAVQAKAMFEYIFADMDFVGLLGAAEREKHLKLWSRLADICRPGLGAMFNSNDAFAWLEEALSPINRGKLSVTFHPYDGSFRVGYPNTDEGGGFTVVGDITDQVPFIKSCLLTGAANQSGPDYLTFGEALKAMKGGKKVYRPEWKGGEGTIMLLELVEAEAHAPYFRLCHIERGEDPFYVISPLAEGDVLEDDWLIYPDEAEESLRP